MAISLDSATNGGSNTGTSLTFSHTCAGLNRILFVAVNDATSNNITGVTYNGVALTQVDSTVNLPGTNQYLSLWYLIAPATGAHNVVISSNVSDSMIGGSISYTGVNQTSPIDVHGNTTVNTAASVSKTLTTTISADWAVAFSDFTGGNGSAGASTTQRTIISSSNAGLYDGNADITPAGNTTLTINNSTNTVGGMIMAAFSAVPPAGGIFLTNFM